MIEELDKELEKYINTLYPSLKNFIEFILRYNENCDAGTVLFNDHDQQCLERCLGVIEDIHNKL